MKLDDGQELLAHLAYPLALDIAGELLGAIGRSAERLGYTDVGILMVGPHAGGIAGTPPARRHGQPGA